MNLRQYQRKAVDLLKSNARYILADDMGLGKTVTAITSIVETDSFPCLVVCPASVKYNWAREIEAWTGLQCEVLEGKHSHPLSSTKFVVINYDILSDWEPFFGRKIFSSVVFDECHYLRNYNKRSRAAVSIAKGCERVLLLSGTPVVNGAQDLYTYFKMIAPSLFKNKSTYCDTFCKKRLNPWTRTIEYYGSKNDDKLNSILQHYMLRRRKEDVLDELPEKNRIPVYVRCDDKKYKFDFSDESTLTDQLSSVLYSLAKDKLPYVYQFVDDFIETGRKILIGCHHVKIASELMSHFGKRAVLINGAVSSGDRQRAVDRFNNDPSCQVLVGNLQAAGEGINLQKACSAVAFVELPFTAATLLQFEDRVYRLGQKNNVSVYFFVASKTVDELLKNILISKISRINKIVEDSKSDTLRDLVYLLKGKR